MIYGSNKKIYNIKATITMNFFLADLILTLHFCIAVFLILGLFTPIAYKFNLGFYKNYYLRLVHLMLISIVLFETLIGVICPLTIIENLLRNNDEIESFISKWLGKFLFWELNITFFILIYFICFCWTVFIWFYYPPIKRK